MKSYVMTVLFIGAITLSSLTGEEGVSQKQEVWQSMLKAYLIQLNGVGVKWKCQEIQLPNEEVAHLTMKAGLEAIPPSLDEDQVKNLKAVAKMNADIFRRKIKTASIGEFAFESFENASAIVSYVFDSGATTKKKFYFNEKNRLLYQLGSYKSLEIRPDPLQHLVLACPVSPVLAALDRLSVISANGGIIKWEQNHEGGRELIRVTTQGKQVVEFECDAETLIPYKIEHYNSRNQKMYSFEVVESGGNNGFPKKIIIEMYLSGKLHRTKEVELVDIVALGKDRQVQEINISKGYTITDLTVHPPIEFKSDFLFNDKK